ncbi:glycosyl hydrolase family 28-related protein [Paenibacillus koleovorans]|uniref:glycosyl hydrolase family 28-related protein n=1 Tax=Paenibacillus koleovorans TaxID=121608 RepID=UPI000FDC60E7|nr:glycosyl hydrolase family 28-related protein [Paenibacillus koleovorans]
MKRAHQTITVGDAAAHIQGYSSLSIQAAVDAVARNEGGTVVLSGGVYEIDRPIRLYEHVRLTGAGRETVLRKIDGVRSALRVDAD